MKKNIVRVLAFALVLILALGIIPLGVFAIEPDIIYVQKEYYETENPTLYDYQNNWNAYGAAKEYKPGETIKTTDYNTPLIIDGKLYDFAGFGDISSITVPDYIDSADAYVAWLKSVDLPFHTGNIEIPKDMGSEEGKKFQENWEIDTIQNKVWIYAGYTSHQHALSYWYSDDTTHWRECLTCKKYLGYYYQFLFQNWHSDGDEDRVCDVCNADIPYHEITVEDTEGGKITVELEEAPHRRKIVANVEPKDGYKLKKIHFIKVRDDGSEQEITRRKTSKSSWWTLMPTYDLKVTAEFVKK